MVQGRNLPDDEGGREGSAAGRSRRRLRAGHRQPLRLADLAADAGVDPADLSRAFTAHFGVPPGEYLRASRVAEVRRLLLETRAPLARIAVDTVAPAYPVMGSPPAAPAPAARTPSDRRGRPAPG